MLTEKAGFQGPDLSAEFSFPYDRTDDDANAEHETDAGHYFRKDRIGAVSPAADRQQQNEETDNDHLKKQNDPVRRTEAAVFAECKKDDPRNPWEYEYKGFVSAFDIQKRQERKKSTENCP